MLPALALASPPADQHSPNQEAYVIAPKRIERDIDLTGRLSDTAWNSAPAIFCPFEIFPAENVPAKQRTWAKVLYNSRYLYFGFACEDSEASAIRAHLADRDDIFQDDFVFVGLDPFRNNQRAYEFVANAYGIQGDLMRTGNNEDASWDAVWYSRGAVNDTGYTVEMAIPFKSLHFPSTETQDWTAMILRIVPRDSRYQLSWTPSDRNDPCSICQGGTLQGLQGLQSTAAFEVLPYAMGYQTGEMADAQSPASGFVNGKVSGRAGAGVRYSPNPSTSVEAVANPDFSQVESDATQISVNSNFSIFYSEKRPFFMNGADLFSTQMTDFYSRMINNPLGAAKFITRTGGLTFAYLAAEDRNSPFIIPGEEGSLFVPSSLKSFSNIFRAKYEFGSNSFVGAIGTARNFSGAHNYTGGVDWKFLFDRNFSFLGQALMSQTREVTDTSVVSDSTLYGLSGKTKRLDGESYAGGGLYAQLRRDARNYSFRVSYQDISPTFQAQNGFIVANDLKTVDAVHDYTIFPMGSVVEWADFFMEGVLHFNHDNARKERWGVAGVTLQMKGQASVTAVVLPYNEELYHGERFYGVRRGELQCNVLPSRMLQISADFQLGRFIHRADTPGVGTGHVISATVVLKPFPPLEADLSYSRSRLRDIQSRELWFDGSISRFVGIYHFTADLFLRLIGQYDQFNRAIEIDPLVSYKVNPFTMFYVGSTHSLTQFDEPFGVRQTARQYFLKLQYLWRD